jgi:hypothetical protein
MRSISLRREPSVRQIDAILRHLEGELTKRGATVTRAGIAGALRFQMPKPWKAPRLGVLLAVTAGKVEVSAGSGGPWRVRYALSFSVLRGIVILLSLALIAFGLSWPDRTNLINALLVLWVVAYGIPYAAATTRFRRIVQACAIDIVERRRAPRDSGSHSISGSHPVASAQEPASPGAATETPPNGIEIRPGE